MAHRNSADDHQQQLHQQGWEAAVSLHRYLSGGGELAPVPTPGILLEQGEIAYGDVSAHYSRFYGTNASYNHHSGFYFGSPMFVAAGLIGESVVNSSNRNRAQAAAQPQWRDFSPCRAILTERRMLLHVAAENRWVTVRHHELVSFLPVLEQWALFTDYQQWEPMRLAGPSVPWLTAATISVLNRGRSEYQQLPPLPLPG
ncbi:hypothetical protein ACIQAC_05770 [Streptomyces sp. NPDC088387]|uniref:hypothetical protein n=1 Tax=Streptomyces sp. NPDC088387 TaxID=3365859 RepID=UPI0037F9C1ED